MRACVHVCVCEAIRSLVEPAMSKNRTILSFDQCASCRALGIELCGKMQIARIEANRVARKSHRRRVEFGRPASYDVGPNTWSIKT